MLNVGNSPSNNGYGGDANQFSNDSELDVEGTTLRVMGNDYGGGKSLLDDKAFLPAIGCVDRVFIIGDKLFETVKPAHRIKSDFIFRLNAADKEGQPDTLYYVGLNRVVGSTSRTGIGLTKALFELF